MTDKDVLSWLSRCAATLKSGGIIVVKENLANDNERFTLGRAPVRCHNHVVACLQARITFKKCSASLKRARNLRAGPGGADEDDASLARSDEYLRELFQAADMKLLLSMAQKGFPPHLMRVKMYALRPNKLA